MIFDIKIGYFVAICRFMKNNNCSMKIIKCIYNFNKACLCWKLFEFQKRK